MNIIELVAQRVPFTIVAIVALILLGIWISKKGSRDSVLYDLYKALWDIRDTERLLVTNATPDIVVQHKKEMNEEIDFLVLQELGKRRGNKYGITPEELSGKRIERLVPENSDIERLKGTDKRLPKLWRNVRVLQTALMDNNLEKLITRFEKMLKLNSAYRVYKEVLTNCYIINIDDYGTLTNSVKVTEDALADAHRAVNRHLAELVSERERSKAQSWIKQENR